jgi:hypothetical protein
MMKLVGVLAELVVFPGWLAATPESGRQFEPQRGAVQQKEAPADHNV